MKILVILEGERDNDELEFLVKIFLSKYYKGFVSIKKDFRRDFSILNIETESTKLEVYIKVGISMNLKTFIEGFKDPHGCFEKISLKYGMEEDFFCIYSIYDYDCGSTNDTNCKSYFNLKNIYKDENFYPILSYPGYESELINFKKIIDNWESIKNEKITYPQTVKSNKFIEANIKDKITKENSWLTYNACDLAISRIIKHIHKYLKENHDFNYSNENIEEVVENISEYLKNIFDKNILDVNDRSYFIENQTDIFDFQIIDKEKSKLLSFIFVICLEILEIAKDEDEDEDL